MYMIWKINKRQSDDPAGFPGYSRKDRACQIGWGSCPKIAILQASFFLLKKTRKITDKPILSQIVRTASTFISYMCISTRRVGAYFPQTPRWRLPVHPDSVSIHYWFFSYTCALLHREQKKKNQTNKLTETSFFFFFFAYIFTVTFSPCKFQNNWMDQSLIFNNRKYRISIFIFFLDT